MSLAPPTANDAGPLGPWRRLGLLLGGLAAAVVLGVLALQLAADRRDVLQRAQLALTAWSAVLADRSASQLRGLEQALASLAELPSAEIPTALALRESLLPPGVALLVLPPGAAPLATPRAAAYLAGFERGALEALRRQAAGAPPGLGQPLRATIGPLLPLWRGLPQGALAIALLPLRSIEGGYAALDLPERIQVALLDAEGRLLAAHPARPAGLGQAWPGLDAAAVLQASPLSWSGRLAALPGEGAAGGAPLKAVATALPGLPALLLTARSEAAILAPWRHQARWSLALAALALLTAAVAGLLLLRQAERQLAARRDATRRLDAVAAGAAGLTTLDLQALLGRLAPLARQAADARMAILLLRGAPPAVSLAERHGLSPDQQSRLLALAAEPALQGAEAPVALPALPGSALPDALCLPLRGVGGTPLGLMLLVAGATPFGPQDREALVPLARMAEGALHHRARFEAMLAALRREEAGHARATTALDALEEPVLLADLTWQVVLANRAGRALLPASAPGGAPPGLWQACPCLAAPEPFAALQRVAASGAPARLRLALPQGGEALLRAWPAGEGVALSLQPLPQPALPAPAAPEAPPPPAARPAHLLLVEDEDPLRDQLAATLRGLGYAVTAVPDAPAALGALAEGAAPDLLLADVVLPGGMSGVGLARAMRSTRPQLPVLLISGFAAGLAEAPDALPLLPKPCPLPQLQRRLQELLVPRTTI
ncbi:response regulator [Pseudoroseomonas cervicalis]|uniref:response regulator n=1 Tax=Teichococcus cervicalis TaxID=204525 RepID=UPI00277D31CE|nr:response regulator [Pseudoroseomonas cervicalis]MDQ1079377.1 CheY-like chemotaxis protein/PAS domain-containing protein [Pseudoroseomonas cervicalis]